MREDSFGMDSRCVWWLHSHPPLLLHLKNIFKHGTTVCSFAYASTFTYVICKTHFPIHEWKENDLLCHIASSSSSSKPCPNYVGVGYTNSVSPFQSRDKYPQISYTSSVLFFYYLHPSPLWPTPSPWWSVDHQPSWSKVQGLCAYLCMPYFRIPLIHPNGVRGLLFYLFPCLRWSREWVKTWPTYVYCIFYFKVKI